MIYTGLRLTLAWHRLLSWTITVRVFVVRCVRPTDGLDHERYSAREHHVWTARGREEVSDSLVILDFGSDDRCRLQEIIEACCLEHDLEMLPQGRDTEIGEKGINLSGKH